VSSIRRWGAIVAGLCLVILAVAVLALLLDDDPTPRVAVPTTAPPTGPLGEFDRATILMSGDEWHVAVASEPQQRSHGLMFVTDLGDLDGMLFVWEEDTTTSFWMKDTPLPLDIAFFRFDGTLVDLFSMEPCVAEPCERYQASDSYRYALEAPRGAFAVIDRPFLEVHSP
jgi:uncharacterized membrane protein (UPF0127 family)